MKTATGFHNLILALLAFSGLGLEALLAFLIEPAIYGTQIGEWTALQNIIHWVFTCMLWGIIGWLLVRYAKQKYAFDLFEKGHPMAGWQWLLTVVLLIGSLILSYLDWDGSKVIKEFHANGPVKFVFQYIYYVFETGLVLLILVFGQKAFEAWFKKPNIPYGGIIAAATWGAAHFFIKDPVTGILTVISGLAYGSIYLLVNRDIRKAYLFLFLMFVL